MFINLIVKPPKATHESKSGQTVEEDMGEKFGGVCTHKYFDVYNSDGVKMECVLISTRTDDKPRPCVVYLHSND